MSYVTLFIPTVIALSKTLIEKWSNIMPISSAFDQRQKVVLLPATTPHLALQCNDH